jgi:hypothetical protein
MLEEDSLWRRNVNDSRWRINNKLRPLSGPNEALGRNLLLPTCERGKILEIGWI